MIIIFFIINTELTRSIDDMNIKKGIIISYVLIEPQVTKITKERILGIYHENQGNSDNWKLNVFLCLSK